MAVLVITYVAGLMNLRMLLFNVKVCTKMITASKQTGHLFCAIFYIS